MSHDLTSFKTKLQLICLNGQCRTIRHYFSKLIQNSFQLNFHCSLTPKNIHINPIFSMAYDYFTAIIKSPNLSAPACTLLCIMSTWFKTLKTCATNYSRANKFFTLFIKLSKANIICYTKNLIT